MAKRKTTGSTRLIACIGASADGIRAMEAFFSNVDAGTDISFVVIQHLSPEHKTILSEILQRKSSLPVQDIKDNDSPKPGQVYVLPSGFDVTFSENRFRLEKYSLDRKGLHLPVDLFLRSLADGYKDYMAAILLSGSGSDGSLGIRDVKDSGGLVMVQDPETTRFPSMPRNAIETGLVDKIARPEDLPALLMEFRKNCHREIEPFEEDEAGNLLGKMFRLIHTRTGHDFSGYKNNTIFRRIRRRMTLHKESSLSGYINLLENNPAEIDHLFKEFLIGVTSFFRNKESFDILYEKVFPEIVHKDRRDPLRIWVTACATGEEVYSIAMLAREYLVANHIRIDMRIFATDVDHQALEVARAGKYKKNIKADVPGNILKKYFREVDDLYQVHKDLRDMITFAEHSAIKDPPYSKLDLISCRNFLIYLEPDTQKDVLNTFHYALKNNGYLFLGQSESHSFKNGLFTVIDSRARIYRYLSRKRSLDPQLYDHKTPASGKRELSVRDFAVNRALNQYLNPFLLIDRKGEIQYSLGKCDNYFRFHVGEPDQNIVSVAREDFKIPVSTLLRKFNEENKPVSFNNIRSGEQDEETVTLRMEPVEKPSHLDHLVIVTVESAPSAPDPSGMSQNEARELSRHSDDYINQVERELQETREYLNSLVEELETANQELKSANEEAQSTNEELQSTIEELETSKEEMQSLNEELETSNTELERRINEVTHINNDLNNFLQSTEIGILFLDRDLQIRRFSPKIKEIVNLVHSDIGRSIQDFGINFLQEQLVEDVKEVLKDLSAVEKEISTGEDRHHWMRILPYRTLEDRIDGVVITFTDVTEKFRVRALIEQSKRWKRYKHLFDHMQQGFALFRHVKGKNKASDEFLLLEANNAFTGIIGADIDKIRKKNISEWFPDKGYTESFIKGAATAGAGEPYYDEWHYRRKRRYYEMLYFSHESDIIALFIQDITSDKEEMKAQKHLSSIVESTEDAIYSESPEGKILSWNIGASRLYGYTEKEALGAPARKLYDIPDDGEKDKDMIMKAGQGNIVSRETVHKRKGGTRVPVSVTKSPVLDDKGRVTAISNIVKDITQIKEREKELLHARDEAERAANLKSIFLANMSHEIRTPLNSILGFSDMLNDEIMGSTSRKYLQTIRDSGKHLLHLINDIVDVSRLDAGELPVHPAGVNIGEVMKRVREQFQGYAAENRKTDIDFRLKLPDDKDDLIIVTDEYRLQQILHNLLSNAFKYDLKGYIEFGYEIHNEDEVTFYVCDTGPGIKKEDMDKIFERFQQGDSELTRTDKVIRGTGLGLAISRGLTERLGGRMWVESEEGKGSRFCFTIPFVKGEGSAAKGNGSPELEITVPSLDGRKIIVAEDDPYSLEMLKFMLKQTGITMFVATEGDKVMELFDNEAPDAILLDIRMPKKDGYQLISEIRSKDPDIPVIAQTAYAMPEHDFKSRQLGFTEYLVKPLSREVLYSVLWKHLG